jgi:hypothetical protein
MLDGGKDPDNSSERDAYVQREERREISVSDGYEYHNLNLGIKVNHLKPSPA